MKRFFCSRLIAVTIAFLVSISPLFATNVAEIDAFDLNPQLAYPLGVDRVSKYLITSATPDQRVNNTMAMNLLGEFMQNADFQEGICTALAQGDYRVARSLRGMLLMLGLNERQADEELVKMAGADGSVETKRILNMAASQVPCRQAFLTYILETPERYPAMVAGLHALWNDPDSRIARLLRQRFESYLSPNEWDQILKGDMLTRWKLNELLEAELLRENVFSVSILAHPTGMEKNPYKLFWARWEIELGKDSGLMQEILDRLRQATPVYDTMQVNLAEAMRNHGGKLMDDYMRASRIPNSRYEWVARYLFGANFHLKKSGATGMDESPADARKMWADKIAKERTWCNYLIWHLTRPATSLGRVTLGAVQSQMEGNLQLAQAIVEVVASKTANDTTDQNHFQVLVNRDFIIKKREGHLATADWLAYSKELGVALERNTAFTRVAMGEASPAGDSFMSLGLSLAMQGSSEMVKAWVETMQQNDALLRSQFIKFAIQSNIVRTQNDGEAWLAAVLFHANESLNPQVGQFKQLWAAWLRTPGGRSVVRERLGLEIWGVPYDVRQLLIDGWSDDPAGYAKWRRMACYLPRDKGGILGKDVLIVTRQSGFLEASLKAMQVGNLEIGDIMVPVWKKMFLRPNSELVATFENELVNGALLGEGYAAAALALSDVVAKEPNQIDASLARVNLDGFRPGKEGRQKFANDLIKGWGSEVRVIVQDVMKDKTVWTAWRNSLFSAILYAGKAKVAADLIAEDSDLQKIWANEVEELFVNDPVLVTEIMHSLARTNNDGSKGNDQLAAWGRSLMESSANNPYFFEQMYADPTGGYQDQVIQIGRKCLSNYDDILGSRSLVQ